MSIFRKILWFWILLASGFATTAVARPQFSQVEQVRIGQSTFFQSLASLSDGSAIVAKPSSARDSRGFSLLKIIDGKSVNFASFSTKLFKIKAHVYYIWSLNVSSDSNDNIIVSLVIYSLEQDRSAERGMELQVVRFDKFGKRISYEFVDSSDPRSYIEEINVNSFSNGKLLIVYNLVDKTVVRSGKRLYVTDVHMALLNSSGAVETSQQVSLDADHQHAGDGRLTSDSLRSGRGVAVAPSGDFRIVWAHGRITKGGKFYSTLAAAQFSASGQRKKFTYFDDGDRSSIATITTFHRADGTSSDVVALRRSGGKYLLRFFAVRSSEKRSLVKQRVKGSDEMFWYGAAQFEDTYALFPKMTGSFDCFIDVVNLDNAVEVGSISLNGGAFANSCGEPLVTTMPDRSVGATMRINGLDKASTYFLRLKAR